MIKNDTAKKISLDPFVGLTGSTKCCHLRFFSIFLNHCTKQKLEQQCTFFLFINDVYTCIFVFKKIAHKKKHVTHVFATIRLTQLSALRMEKSADWSQKGAAGR